MLQRSGECRTVSLKEVFEVTPEGRTRVSGVLTWAGARLLAAGRPLVALESQSSELCHLRLVEASRDAVSLLFGARLEQRIDGGPFCHRDAEALRLVRPILSCDFRAISLSAVIFLVRWPMGQAAAMQPNAMFVKISTNISD